MIEDEIIVGDCYEDELMAFAYQTEENPEQANADLIFAVAQLKEVVAKHGLKKVIYAMDNDLETAFYYYYLTQI